MDYLNQIRQKRKAIDRKWDHLRVLGGKLSPSGNANGIKIQGTRDVHRMEKLICKYSDLRDEIIEEEYDLFSMKHEMIGLIECLDDPDDICVLIDRYVFLQPWRAIAERNGKCERHIYKIEKRAVKRLQSAYEGVCDA